MLLWLDRRSCSHFCMFPKVWSASHTPGNALVYLNVYDLPPMNGFMYWAGLGIFHTGVEVHGVEYVFGAHDYPSSGVFEVREFMELQSVNYSGDTYHLIMKNCNHFCKEICHKMTGSLCKC
ncbi:deSI-like protein At4g17486 isoform X2 [Musa acuminata AAA Group]|uniref:deSI-like protein At4g17486 isoform X2 n=1 Tax=Musa acuminata AAA Group TaxID=214697 RepID=UPI0031D3C5CB